ncbi:hypothetical protein DAKH74_001550 [Maudiozyma humilis]|uniref:Uncharacterized protein n=1 Tax=Maudiozyma humilis TaxID=51915 RepID=A0AAV5RSM5_MAUHU|nr:hypothetical protein DAKH74_001550 [Kazachstania humilis]
MNIDASSSSFLSGGSGPALLQWGGKFRSLLRSLSVVDAPDGVGWVLVGAGVERDNTAADGEGDDGGDGQADAGVGGGGVALGLGQGGLEGSLGEGSA